MTIEEFLGSVHVFFEKPRVIQYRKIASKLNVSEAALRFYFNILVKKGFIEIVGKNCDWEDMYQVTEKGRQYKSYPRRAFRREVTSDFHIVDEL